MPRRIKSRAYDAGEHLARSINEGFIGEGAVRATWRKAAKFLNDSDWLDFVAGYNAMMLDSDKFVSTVRGAR